MNLILYYDLYISADLEKKKDKILKKLEQNKFQRQIQLITLSQGEQNHLEFFSSYLLKQKLFQETPLFLVGIAGGYGSAVELIQKITEDTYQETGQTNIRQFLLERQEKHERGGV